MHVVLAPMEGVIDDLMREILSEINPYDLVVTEFVRVINQLLPEKVYHKLCPELRNGGLTASGTPVRIQLLGQHPQVMAENAQRAVELGSCGVDANFGCPAKMVNRSNGGAVLLQYPDKIHDIVKAMRDAVPADQPVTAKIRLGYEDKSLFMENAIAVYEAGATELAIHARSKTDGYKPPAYWEYITEVRERLPIPIIANGEIWNSDDAKRCMAVTGCDSIMLGRGAMSLPNLAATIKGVEAPYTWSQTLNLLLNYTQKQLVNKKIDYYPARVKQWFTYLNKQYPEADVLFRELRVLKTAEGIIAILEKAHEQQLATNG
ncbi:MULTISPECIES: tRNA-dihydrouridine synthase [unclassified Shewanella]|uniref:tRNA-dihydrouridine synthase n=1 Tax=unclassified Shewanella TaxID=196818 RepID=UPI000C8428D1|nr:MULTISPECIES: tRNA-dihydrouridine synthase [unclassified Shewanella]MDO6639394.1 tRNA-dihydrouridine synthase [Shewanella sp. 5_MG-2023]MDO6678158.1 tRNA-dihydrouridine synthase [Shewanella sp. 4_MG-2023]PMG30316.1 tRNA dihydrouridine(16) synthase DusC [Shewanella sp. 10N.286.52.C2]PMG39601.1 tRNA dihydrouridine(16) synthase DusC [Shewanella sp. 10N.286.52.B9]